MIWHAVDPELCKEIIKMQAELSNMSCSWQISPLHLDLFFQCNLPGSPRISRLLSPAVICSAMSVFKDLGHDCSFGRCNSVYDIDDDAAMSTSQDIPPGSYPAAKRRRLKPRPQPRLGNEILWNRASTSSPGSPPPRNQSSFRPLHRVWSIPPHPKRGPSSMAGNPVSVPSAAFLRVLIISSFFVLGGTKIFTVSIRHRQHLLAVAQPFLCLRQ
ncbi:hypothetical protein C8R47DRAFT_1104221 [Mycena vitilis]|nr:hypothetical protein C8R47DRAFT_1104221 [Mycena vitilis]